MAQPLVSVVTPFYNSAEYLDGCIESVLRQSYPAWEYVLLDNRSQDGSAEIAERYARRDPRIRFIRMEEFVGQVENYNRALERIDPASRYCKMIQADDRLLPGCLEQMVELAAENPSIGVISSYSLYGTEVGHDSNLEYRDRHVLSGLQARRRYLLSGKGFFGSPTCVMYRSDLVRARRPFFALNSPCEDLDVCFELLDQSDLGFVHQVLSFNRRDNGGYWGRVSAYGALVLYDLLLLVRYGGSCLSEGEYHERLAAVERGYYRMLGKHVVMATASRDFWAFHRDSLRAVGRDIVWARVWREAALHGLDLLLNPKSTVQGLLGRLRRRPPPGAVAAHPEPGVATGLGATHGSDTR